MALAVELGELLGIGHGELIALLGEVDLLGGLLLDGGGGQHFTAVLGEVLHRGADHVALTLGDRLERLDRGGRNGGQSRKVLAAGLDEGLDRNDREFELAGKLAEVEIGERILEGAIGVHGILLGGRNA